MKLYHHIHKIWLLNLLEKHKVYKHAAAESGLTQSALSQNISNLEKVFGKPLIIKSKMGIELTEFAQKIVLESRPILHLIDLLYSKDDERSGVIKIGAYDSLAVQFLPKIVPTLNEMFTDAKFQIINGRSGEIKPLVKNGSLDFGLIIDDGEDFGLEETFIAEVGLGLYSSKQYSEFELQKELYINGVVSLALQTNELPSYFQSFLGELPYKFKISSAFSSFDSIYNLLLSSKNVGVLPDLLAKNNSQLFKVWDGGNSHHLHSINLVSRPNVRIDIKKALSNLLINELM